MKKRKQHYVWKHYLEEWTTNGQLFCLQGKRIFLTNPINVAQKRDFYRLNELNENDIALVKTLWVDTSPPFLQPLHTDLLKNFNVIFELKKLYEASGRTDLELEKQLDTTMNNLEENLHCGIEGMAVPYLEKIRDGDISFYDKEQNRIEFTYYLATQYFRTNRMKDRIKVAFSNMPQKYAQFGLNIERIWNVVSHIMATNVGFSLSREDSNMQLVLLKNNTKIPFITSDQPLINLKLNHVNFEPPSELEWYYPLSPNAAIILAKNNRSSFSGNLVENNVISLNASMVAMSHEQAYSSEQSALERYL